MKLLPLLRFHHHHGSSLEPTAIGAHAVRQNRLIAMVAELNLNRRCMMVAAPVPLLGSGSTPLGNGHDNLRFPYFVNIKGTVILET